MDPRVGFIGAGRVAGVLAEALQAAGYRVAAVASRTQASARRLGERLADGVVVARSPQAVADACDLVFITTPDDAIKEVAGSVRWRAGQRVAHCSGGLSVATLAAVTDAGGHAGGFHPLQTFAGGSAGLAGVTIALEGEDPVLTELKAMAEAVGDRWIVVPSEGKALYHICGVLASNYVVTLFEQATRALESLGVPRGEASRALMTLLRGTVENIEALGAPAALTGPIARGDAGTIQRHMDELERAAPGLKEAYRALGLLAVPIARARGSLAVSEARRIETTLDQHTRARPGGRVLAPQEV